MSLLLTRAGGSGSAAPALLADGVYWQSGDAFTAGKTPHEGQGWTLTTALTDGSADDTTTRVTSTGATISVLDVRTAFALASWLTQCKWKSTISTNVYEWSGSAYTDLGASQVPTNHFLYQDDPADFTGFITTPTSKKQHLIVITANDISGNEFMSMSDSRIS